MAGQKSRKGYGFGTAPVFLAAISTILGALLFLRFGYAVANTGLSGAIFIIIIGHAITIPTALALAEISTNLKVEGGGEYYIISRSFGTMIGGTIGISLYLSQTISVAFYMIAFSQAFTPLFGWISTKVGFIPQTWMISVPFTLILIMVMLKKGAGVGVTALWIVVGTLAVSLIMFFAGKSHIGLNSLELFNTIEKPDDFFIVFAIIFPAFTGMTAGVGLSGDLKNPRKSIPLGTISATLIGMIIYVLVSIKLSASLTPQEMVADQLAMSKVALWGPIIPIGLAAATISSAIGSILVAPRTLQALAGDQIFPGLKLNQFLAAGKGDSNEPVNSILLSSVIILIFVSLGSIDFVAKIISMFFMITYGSLCLVSFLEHFAGNPSYRPTFRTQWYFSLIGALACFIMMFQMAPLYAFLAIIVIIIIYYSLKKSRAGEPDLSGMVRGVLFQLTRKLQVLIQRKQSEVEFSSWRPSFVAISSSSLTRLAPFDLLRWISHYYGFGTFFHFIKGPLEETTHREAKKKLEQLIKQGKMSRAGIYVDTIISPSFKTAVAQIVQMPGIAGLENNSIMFEFDEDEPAAIADIIDGCQFAAITEYNLCVLRSSERHFGYRKHIHIWLTPGDYRNANMMILLAYIIMGHPDWKGCEIDLLVAFDEKNLDKEVRRLNRLIEKGRIPISKKNVQKIAWKKRTQSYESLITEHSEMADLVIMGFSLNKIVEEKGAFFKQFKTVQDILFVRAGHRIAIENNFSEEIPENGKN